MVAVAYTLTHTNHIKSVTIRPAGYLFFKAISGGSFHLNKSNPYGIFLMPSAPIHSVTFCTSVSIRLHQRSTLKFIGKTE